MAIRSLHRDRSGARQSHSGGERVIDLTDSEAPLVIDPLTVDEPGQVAGQGQLRETRFFGSPAFRRLWLSQVLSSLGDWIGLVALTVIAKDVGGDNFGGGAVSLVLAARILPGLFMSPFVGVMLDRLDRKRVMVLTDIGRGLVLCGLPFVHNLPALFFASLLLELMTLMWSPAKEASVPNMVRKSFLPTANSLSLGAAYGTFIPAMAVSAVLVKIPDWIGQDGTLSSLNLSREAVLLYFDAMTYILSAIVIATLAIASPKRKSRENETRARAGFREAREGWQFIGRTPRVRAVILGMALALVGGGVIVPLGPDYADKVLKAGPGGYGMLMAMMGSGVGIGVIVVSILQRKISLDRVFVVTVFGAGAALGAASAMSGLAATAICICAMGLCVGAIYVLGFTMLQVSVEDDMRGRVFAAFYTVTRLCILFALIAAPLLALAIDGVFDSHIEVMGIDMFIPGVRITLLLGAIVMLGGGVVAGKSLHRPTESEAAST